MSIVFLDDTDVIKWADEANRKALRDGVAKIYKGFLDATTICDHNRHKGKEQYEACKKAAIERMHRNLHELREIYELARREIERLRRGSVQKVDKRLMSPRKGETRRLLL